MKHNFHFSSGMITWSVWYNILLNFIVIFICSKCSAELRTEIHSRDMAHAHNIEDKLKPEMSVKPSALWQKRQVSAWCSLVLCVNMLKCTVLRTYRTFKISSSTALGTRVLAWNLKIVGNDVLLLHLFFFYQFNFFDEFRNLQQTLVEFVLFFIYFIS